MSEKLNILRLVIAAHKGGAGKTLLAVGLAAALRRRGISLAAFKKGPDYIDAGWLGLAAGVECHNLDSYLFDRDVVLASFALRTAGKDLALIEGNRGIFDGVDSAGSYSTAEIAKLIGSGVILVIDATKMTRTAAAFVMGCRVMDQELDLRGVILNRVAGARHERILRESIEIAAGVPVVGSVQKLALERFPQRHLGLLPWHEHPQAQSFIDEAAGVAEEFIDIDRLLELAAPVRTLDVDTSTDPFRTVALVHGEGLRIGVLRDSAFQFYYPENLEALVRSGARTVSVSAMGAEELPPVDALYIGGGFPETHAERLAENTGFKRSVLEAIERGLPVYAECGGLMYLARNLVIDAKAYPMVGALPVDVVLEKTPQGHGYIQAEVAEANPFYPIGSVLTGHEFHYSRVAGLEESGVRCAFRVLRGHGLDGNRDGMCVGNILATYVHVHALGTPAWAECILKRAADFHAERSRRGHAVGCLDRGQD